MIAHSLKSSSANLGATGFSRICARLEEAAREQRSELLPAQLQMLESLLPRMLHELRRQVEPVEDDTGYQPAEKVSAAKSSAPVVLVADDDTGFRLTTCEALRGTGFNVIEADSGPVGATR